jgi:Uncharacterised nucleotidyltransferase
MHASRANPTGRRVPSISSQAEPTLASAAAESFYAEAIRELVASGIPFLLAGTYAVCAYTGISRQTKDLDVFCKAGDYPRILAYFQERGYAIEVTDDRWLGKIRRGDDALDVIFSSLNGAMPVGEEWFEHARQTQVFGTTVRMVGSTELVWSKCFIQLRHRYDGADVAHMILKAHAEIDWHRLLGYMEAYWEVLLIHLLNFRWMYPSERDKVPSWLLDELLDRLAKQRQLPAPERKVCRGRMYSRSDYEIDVTDWGFADVGAERESGPIEANRSDSRDG